MGECTACGGFEGILSGSRWGYSQHRCTGSRQTLVDSAVAGEVVHDTIEGINLSLAPDEMQASSKSHDVWDRRERLESLHPS